MPNDFSQIYHQSSKDMTAGGTWFVPEDSSLWPIEWHTKYYKDYPRFEKLALPQVRPQADLYHSISSRRTSRNFDRAPFSIEQMSAALKYSCGITSDDERGRLRAQPSGGARYPIEVYPLVCAGNDTLPAGLYHYNVDQHALDVLWKRPIEVDDIARLFTYPWIRQASVIFVMTAVFHRNQDKYRERGYRHILLEAGHIGQNMYLHAAAQGLKCCGLGGTLDVPLEKFIDVDGVSESVVYAVAMG